MQLITRDTKDIPVASEGECRPSVNAIPPKAKVANRFTVAIFSLFLTMFSRLIITHLLYEELGGTE